MISAVPIFNITRGLETHAVRSSKTVIVHKIAVMPLVDAPDQLDKTLPVGASESVTADIYSHATVMGGWEVVPQDDVDRAMQQMPPTTPLNMDQNALELGRKVLADGVNHGRSTNIENASVTTTPRKPRPRSLSRCPSWMRSPSRLSGRRSSHANKKR